jgi:RNase H-fold protein (predicted Holliday junction resolvase)
VVLVWGGSKDVAKNETKMGTNSIQRFVKTNNHKTFILMDIPHRYDLEQTPRVNKEVEKYNRRLRKHMKVFENTEIIKVYLEEVSQNKVSI